MKADDEPQPQSCVRALTYQHAPGGPWWVIFRAEGVEFNPMALELRQVENLLAGH